MGFGFGLNPPFVLNDQNKRLIGLAFFKRGENEINWVGEYVGGKIRERTAKGEARRKS